MYMYCKLIKYTFTCTTCWLAMCMFYNDKTSVRITSSHITLAGPVSEMFIRTLCLHAIVWIVELAGKS